MANLLVKDYRSVQGVVDSQAGDIAALEAIASNSTNLGSWTDNTRWSTSGMSLDPAPYGVTVESIGGELRVTEIKLGFNNIAGALPDTELGNLKEMAWFNVKGNNLTGSLPTGLFTLPKLEVMVLSGNGDYTEPPTGNGAFSLTNVQNSGKDLSTNNDFSGSIPDTFNELPALRVIELGHSSITGSLPSTFLQATSMQIIYMAWNQSLTGDIPSDIGNQMTDLYQLQMSTCDMTGTIPSSLDNCSNLYNLKLGNRDSSRGTNTFSSLPDLSNTNLDFVSISRVGLSQDFPAWLVGPNGSRHFNLTWNSITGTIPDLDPAISYRQVIVDGNNITGSIPSNLNSFGALIQLGFGFNDFSGDLPADLSNLNNIRFMYFDHNPNITGTLPLLPASAPDCSFINCRGNSMSGYVDPANAEIANNPDMGTDDLDLSANNFSDADLTDLRNALDADGNLHVLRDEEQTP